MSLFQRLARLLPALLLLCVVLSHAAAAPEGARARTLAISSQEQQAVSLVNTLLDDRTNQPASLITGTLTLYAEGAPFIEAPFETDAAGVYTFTATLPISTPLQLEHLDMVAYPRQYYQLAYDLGRATSLEFDAGTSTRVLTSRLTTFSRVCAPERDVYPLTFEAALLDGLLPGDTLTVSVPLEAPSVGGFLDWEGVTSANDLHEAWGEHGSLASGFDEDDHQYATGPLAQLDHRLEAGDWMHAVLGSFSSVEPDIAAHVDAQTVLRLPLLDQSYGGGSALAYRFSKLARFQLLAFSLESTGPGRYFYLRYLGDELGKACGSSRLLLPLVRNSPA